MEHYLTETEQPIHGSGNQEQHESPTPPFPFPDRIRRPGEPDVPHRLAPDEPMPESAELAKLVIAHLTFQKWAQEQPDGPMIFEDIGQRRVWAESKGTIPLKKMYNDRWLKVVMCRMGNREEGTLDAFEQALDTYWPNNEELRHPPSTFNLP